MDNLPSFNVIQFEFCTENGEVKMKTIIFKWRYGVGEHEIEEEEFEFDGDATEEEINAEWKEWVWSKVSEQFTWYEK
ncbi:hypothetical protein [Bacillus tropicus]|uniref:hypothetical protein n=1 Tax=Bacillus tropicus TaxID=2026188 RepID=UPI003D1DC8C7